MRKSRNCWISHPFLLNSILFSSVLFFPPFAIISHLPPVSTMALSPTPQQNVPKRSDSPLFESDTFGPLENGADGLQLLAHSSRMARTCRHHCSISDPNAKKCWNDTLTFYEQMLVGTLRRVILVETNRIMWMFSQRDRRYRSASVNYTKLSDDSFRRFLQLPRGQIIADKNNWEKAPFVFERISPAIVHSVRLLLNKLHNNHYYSNKNNNGHGTAGGGQWPLDGVPPPLLRFDCPRPCERSFSMWKWLFLSSLLLFFAQFGLICLFVFLLDRREQKMWRTESTEFGENASVVLVKS